MQNYKKCKVQFNFINSFLNTNTTPFRILYYTIELSTTKMLYMLDLLLWRNFPVVGHVKGNLQRRDFEQRNRENIGACYLTWVPNNLTNYHWFKSPDAALLVGQISSLNKVSKISIFSHFSLYINTDVCVCNVKCFTVCRI